MVAESLGMRPKTLHFKAFLVSVNLGALDGSYEGEDLEASIANLKGDFCEISARFLQYFKFCMRGWKLSFLSLFCVCKFGALEGTYEGEDLEASIANLKGDFCDIMVLFLADWDLKILKESLGERKYVLYSNSMRFLNGAATISDRF
jgi:hypothetical protein